MYRPSSGYWFVNGGAITAFGTTGDIPLPIPDAIRRSFFLPLEAARLLRELEGSQSVAVLRW